MKEYYASLLEENFLQEKAKTDKRISDCLDNISTLNEDEYSSLYAFFMYEGCATNYSWRFTCSCYLMLLQERDPIRFRKNFSSVFFRVYGSCNSQVFCEDYYDLCGLLIVCDFDVYTQLFSTLHDKTNDDIWDNSNETDRFNKYKLLLE